MEVKRKALAVALEMTTSRNVEEVVLFLKKQLRATVDSNNETYDKSVEQEFRQLLIQSIHSCAIKFSEVAANVVHVLMDFLGDNNNPSAVDVIAFVRCVADSVSSDGTVSDGFGSFLEQRGSREVPSTAERNYGQADLDIRRDQVRKSLPRRLVDCWRVL